MKVTSGEYKSMHSHSFDKPVETFGQGEVNDHSNDLLRSTETRGQNTTAADSDWMKDTTAPAADSKSKLGFGELKESKFPPGEGKKGDINYNNLVNGNDSATNQNEGTNTENKPHFVFSQQQHDNQDTAFNQTGYADQNQAKTGTDSGLLQEDDKLNSTYSKLTEPKVDKSSNLNKKSSGSNSNSLNSGNKTEKTENEFIDKLNTENKPELNSTDDTKVENSDKKDKEVEPESESSEKSGITETLKNAYEQVKETFTGSKENKDKGKETAAGKESPEAVKKQVK